MKHVKLFEDWTDFLQLQADAAGMTRTEWMSFYGVNNEAVVSEANQPDFQKKKH